MDREQWGTYRGKDLCRRAQAKNDHIGVPFVSDTLGSMSGESALTLCVFAWHQAVREVEFSMAGWGGGAGADNGANALVGLSKLAFHRWDTRLTSAVWRATAARATVPGARVAKNCRSDIDKAAPFRETGVLAPPSPFHINEKW